MGMSKKEKLDIALGYATPLLKKIKSDLEHTTDENGNEGNSLNDHRTYRLDTSGAKTKGIASPGRHVRTRLYFTSESHIHSLINILRYGDLASLDEPVWQRALEYISMVPELNYLTQIVIMLYEDPNVDINSENRFHVELHFSPGEKLSTISD